MKLSTINLGNITIMLIYKPPYEIFLFPLTPFLTAYGNWRFQLSHYHLGVPRHERGWLTLGGVG